MSERPAAPDLELLLAKVRLEEADLNEWDALLRLIHARNPEGPRLRQMAGYVPLEDPLALDFLEVGLREAGLALPAPLDALRTVVRHELRRIVSGELDPEAGTLRIAFLAENSDVPYEEYSEIPQLWNFHVYARYLRGASDVGDGGWYDEILDDIVWEAAYHLGLRDRPPPSFGDPDYDERRAAERARRAALPPPAPAPVPEVPRMTEPSLAPALGGDDQTPEEAYALGLAYENGTGVPRDLARAVTWYRKAANFFHPAALNNLGCLYDRGEGVPRDRAKAIECFLAAAERENGRAQCTIGYAYETGDGLPPDRAQALAWYRRAAENDSGAAHANLGNIYSGGDWVPRDLDLALHHYRRAADLGEPRGMYNLGSLHQRGEGVPQDFERAADWFRRAYDALHRQRR